MRVSVSCAALGVLTTGLSLLVIALRPLPRRWRQPLIGWWWRCLLRWQDLVCRTNEDGLADQHDAEPELPAGIGWRRPTRDDGCYVNARARESTPLRWREAEPVPRSSEGLAPLGDRDQAVAVEHR